MSSTQRKLRARKHVEELRSAVSGPRDARFLVAMLGWSAALPVLKFVLPLPRLVRFMHSDSRGFAPDTDHSAKIVALAHWVFRSRPRKARDNCLERALVTYRYLGRAGVRPELIVGMSRDSESTIGHVWVTVGGRPVHDEPDGLERFATILVFGDNGERVSTGRLSPSGGSGEAILQTPVPPPEELPG
jgi:hypothetical protein